MMTTKGLFLTGTDTDIGKTYVGCLIAQQLVEAGHSIRAYKPVASGFANDTGSDGERLWRATGCRGPLRTVSPQSFREPFAPPVAAAIEGREVSHDQILQGYVDASSDCDLVLVEGAGGLMSPISDRWTNADLIVKWKLPIVLVAAWKLGVVNQVLTSLVAADALDISVAAIVINACSDGPKDRSHITLLTQYVHGDERGGFPTTHRMHWKSIPIIELDHDSDQFKPICSWSDFFASAFF